MLVSLCVSFRKVLYKYDCAHEKRALMAIFYEIDFFVLIWCIYLWVSHTKFQLHMSYINLFSSIFKKRYIRRTNFMQWRRDVATHNATSIFLFKSFSTFNTFIIVIYHNKTNYCKLGAYFECRQWMGWGDIDTLVFLSTFFSCPSVRNTYFLDLFFLLLIHTDMFSVTGFLRVM